MLAGLSSSAAVEDPLRWQPWTDRYRRETDSTSCSCPVARPCRRIAGHRCRWAIAFATARLHLRLIRWSYFIYGETAGLGGTHEPVFVKRSLPSHPLSSNASYPSKSAVAPRLGPSGDHTRGPVAGDCPLSSARQTQETESGSMREEFAGDECAIGQRARSTQWNGGGAQVNEDQRCRIPKLGKYNNSRKQWRDTRYNFILFRPVCFWMGQGECARLVAKSANCWGDIDPVWGATRGRKRAAG